jgi:hypothetical protein
MTTVQGRPGRAVDPSQADAHAFVGWLARTHRYNSPDVALATATAFASRLANHTANRSIGPAMVSRLENGSATWLADHLIVYEKTLDLRPGKLMAPACRLLRSHGRSTMDFLNRRITPADEQAAADIVDCVLGGDVVTAADWDLLSACLIVTGRKLGVRTWSALIERLVLEICASQGIDQEMRSEALVRLSDAEIAIDIISDSAIGMMTQRGNPQSFQPLIIYRMMPQRAPAAWIARALLNPPDRWLLRELFSTVAILVGAGEWQPSAAQLRSLRRECADTIGDSAVELEVRRAGMQLLRKLGPDPRRFLGTDSGPELAYLAKSSFAPDAQSARYGDACRRIAAEVQEVGLTWQAKWENGEDLILGNILIQSLVGRSDDLRSSSTSLVINSGYATALRQVLFKVLGSDDVTSDRVFFRALIRLFGKLASGAGDGDLLIKIIGSERIDVDTRIQACWALGNCASRMPRSILENMLSLCREKSFGAQSGTAIRAAVAACGRAGIRHALDQLGEDNNQALAIRDECRWWNSLPHYIRRSTASE